jgi:ABC-type hemin transport system substrate-binding protein
MRRLIIGLVFCVFAVAPVAAERVVSLSPATTEIVAALGGNLVGVTTACDYPLTVKSLPQVGDFVGPRLEDIVAVRPSLIVGIGNPNTPAAIKLKTLGVPTLLFESPHTIAEVYALITKIGTALNRPEKAQRLVQQLRDQIAAVRPLRSKPSVVVVLWTSPLVVAGPQTFVADVIRAAGGNPIVGGTLDYPKLSRESLMALQPDIIVLGDRQLKGDVWRWKLRSKTGMATRIVDTVTPDLFLRPGPRLGQGATELSKWFRPQ